VIDSLLGNHNSESVEINHGLLGLSGGELLGPSGLVPGFSDSGLGKGFFEYLGGTTTTNWDMEVGQRQPTDWELLSLNT